MPTNDHATETNTTLHRVNKLLEQAYQQNNQSIELVRRMQQRLQLPSLPELPEIRFAVQYRSCGRAGGDGYDLFRLDEQRVGFYLFDVLGHGVPAGLLAVFLKAALRMHGAVDSACRLVHPDRVLQQVNRAVLDLALPEAPFLTMIYGLCNGKEQKLSLARAGHPLPLYLPHGGEPTYWQVEGALLGVFETQFSVQTYQLRPGDRVLFYSDGLNSVGEEAAGAGAEQLRTAAAQCRHLPLTECLSQLALRLVVEQTPAEDFTLLGLEIPTSSAPSEAPART
jgi:sigma-B regulation protein RsbU (phosphoserine phosphatase)